MVNTPICGVWRCRKTMRREKGGGAFSPSENNHDLEPIGKVLFAGYFLSIPVIPVDDRCRIGQHLNRVKPKMVNSKGYAGTAPQGPEKSVWRIAKWRTRARSGESGRAAMPIVK